MSFQGNKIEDRDSLSVTALKGSVSNPFKIPYMVLPKKLLIVQTLMQHTGSKEELYRTLTIQGKQSLYCQILIFVCRLDLPSIIEEHLDAISQRYSRQ